MRTVAKVAVFVTRRRGREALLVHRSPEQGGYWHVVAGGVESGETAVEAAEREFSEETGLVAEVSAGIEVIETPIHSPKNPQSDGTGTTRQWCG